jgi:hypothetical protein
MSFVALSGQFMKKAGHFSGLISIRLFFRTAALGPGGQNLPSPP